MTKDKKTLIYIIIVALAIKLFFFGYAAVNAPLAKISPDTPSYLEPGMMLVEKGLFATERADGTLHYETVRTPGFPLFYGLLHGIMKLPDDGVVLVQVLLTVLAGIIVYFAAVKVSIELVTA